MWNADKKDELMSCLVMNSSRAPGFPSDQAVSAAALTYTEWVTPHSHHKYNAFYVNKAKMEDSEGNKEKNVVKVLAKRPPQSTETEVGITQRHNSSLHSTSTFTEWKNISFNLIFKI